MISTMLLAAAFYGLTFDPASTNVPSSARIYPIRYGVYEMVQPDGQERRLRIVDYEKNLLAGERPWVGVIRQNRIDIWADPDFTGGKLRTGYTFVNGQLMMMKLDGKVFSFPAGNPQLEGAVESLFSERRERSMEKGSAGDIWSDDRLRLWFANPNSAGLLMAELMLASLALAAAMRRWWKAPFLVMAAILLGGMVLSGSRGALLSFCVGMLLLAGRRLNRLLSWRGAAIVALAIVTLTAAVAVCGQLPRLCATFTGIDTGNMLRVKVAKAALMMFADSPFGWHGGEVAGRSGCLNWYVFDESHIIRTHLLTLAEMGWLKGFAYILFWLGMMSIGFLSAKGVRRPVSLALWAAFFVAGWLNPVYTEWELWILPALSVLPILWRCRYVEGKKLMRYGAVSGAVALASVVVLVLAGTIIERPTPVPLNVRGSEVLVNGDIPKIWVVEDIDVLGGAGFPGREILTHYISHPEHSCLAYVHELADLPSAVDALVLPGRAAADFLRMYREGGKSGCRAKKILFLSPAVGPEVMPEELLRESSVKWIAGYFAALRNQAYAVEREWVDILPGAELYVPNWVSTALRFACKSDVI